MDEAGQNALQENQSLLKFVKCPQNVDVSKTDFPSRSTQLILRHQAEFFGS